MAKSKFEYVKKFELDDKCLPGCWIVVRIDGRNFHQFTTDHNFKKPNDERALSLMDSSANSVMHEFRDIILAYGQSDEYSFVFHRNVTLFNRRASKLMSNVVSMFASNYVYKWSEHFPDVKLKYPPMFDSRVVLYPTIKILRDYLSWRQTDCHVNNLHNTAFWSIIGSGKSPTDASLRLRDTYSSDKNEILFSEFGINYNNIEPRFRKGCVIYWDDVIVNTTTTHDNNGANGASVDDVIKSKVNSKNISKVLKIEHLDIISDAFWQQHPNILLDK